MIPVIIGGRIFYVEKLKTSVDIIFGMKKLNTERKKFKNKVHRTKLDKTITGLLLIMSNFLPITGQSYKACLAQIDLLQLTSDQAIDEKINSFNINTLFSLSQNFQLELLWEQKVINQIKQNLKQQTFGLILKSELDDLDLVLEIIPQWVNNVAPKISRRLQELNQEILKKHNLIIQHSLGSGQSGEVYLCTDKKGQDVAVKIMPKNGGLTSRISIKYEKDVWKQIKDVESDNVIKHKSIVEERGVTCFTMDYIDGLQELSKITPIEINDILNWANQIFSGLSALHEKNIAHRDIKLENILITNGGRIKICDFGISKRSDLTVTICGTLGMMAPEIQKFFPLQQKADSKYDGKKCDVYSAAAVIYCLIFNKKTTDMVNETFNTTILSTRTKDRFGNEIGQNLHTFLERCLDSNPDTRATAKQAIQLLNQIV
ncbi:MAG: serine/threonine-protein kinase [Oscillospiraceae bacterium]|nr:serine/threonine-protein kinase [Oscillospiraceae bacterium]